MGFSTPTPIQQQAIPVILDNKDLIACAQTGTGKTGAYLLPIMDKIVRAEKRHLNTLVIAPTRELAQQIDQQIEGFGYFIGVSSISVYGGGDGATWDQQRRALEQGADIIIATPGRLIALRMEKLREYYPWLSSGLDYFTGRLTQAPEDAEFALSWVVKHARTREEQDVAHAALRAKCDILWAMLDALYFAYVQPGWPPPGAFHPERTNL